MKQALLQWLNKLVRDPVSNDPSSTRVFALLFAVVGAFIGLTLTITTAIVALQGGSPETVAALVGAGAASLVGAFVGSGAVALLRRTKATEADQITGPDDTPTNSC